VSDIGDRPATPAVDLVAEELRATSPAGADGAFGDRPAITVVHGDRDSLTWPHRDSSDWLHVNGASTSS
jgi:hypothetical protein